MKYLPTQPTDEFLASIRPELVQAFSARPSFGRVGFRCVFREGQLERIEFEYAVSKMPQVREDG
jgi:hypothetical protein